MLVGGSFGAAPACMWRLLMIPACDGLLPTGHLLQQGE